MKIKNSTWVSYKNKPHFVISSYPEETHLRNLEEQRIVVPTKDLSPFTIPQFEIGDRVLYIDTFHKNLIGKVVTIVEHNNSGYAQYEVQHTYEYEHVAPFDIVKINY